MKRFSAALFAMCIGPVALAEDYYDLQIERAARNIANVQSYHGVLSQQGLYGKSALVSEIVFRRPHEIRATVTAPAELAGSVVSYHNDELLTYWPKQEMALVIRHFVPPSSATEKQRISDSYRANIDAYLYGLGPVKEVSGKPTIQVDQRARNASQLVQSSLTRVYDEFSFPLSGQLTVRGGARLDYLWQAITFNDDTALPAPPVLPASTLLIQWDLAWPARTPAEISARVPKAVVFPETFAGIARERLLLHPEAVPAVGALYHDENYYCFITASRDVDWTPFQNDYGLPVPLDDLKARMTISAVNTSWSFRRDGVRYEVLSNAHPERIYRELTAWMASAPTKSTSDQGKKP